MKAILFVCCLLFLSVQTHAQNYFQKIYNLEDTTAIFHDIHIFNDSNVMIVGNVFRANSHSKTIINKIDSLGNIIFSNLNSKQPYTQNSNFSKTNSQINFNGELVLGFTNSFTVNSASGIPRIMTLNQSGAFLFDTIYNTFGIDSVLYGNMGTLIYNSFDSTYFFSLIYVDYLSDSNPQIGFDGESGTEIFKFDKDFNILWKKRFHGNPTQGQYFFPAYLPSAFYMKSNQSIFLTVREYFYNAPGNAENDWGKTHFYVLDTAGLVLQHKVFQDTQFDYSGNAYLPLANGDIIATYFESRLTGIPPNSDYFEHRPVITRLDSNLNQIWKDTLGYIFGNISPYNTPSKVLQINDSTIVYAYEYIRLGIAGDNYVAMRLESRNLDGQINWQREYMYYDDGAEYQILDVEKFTNGDLIFGGQVINYDLINANKSGQNGYILKTNCLGFMGNPEAQFTYSVSDTTLTIHNQSIQAGSFEWIVDDSLHFYQTEYEDSLQLTLPYGSHSVVLKAIGCQNIQDSASLQIIMEEKQDTLVPSFDNLLTIYPNPIENGKLLTIFVGKTNKTNLELRLEDEQGRMIQSMIVPNDESFYVFPVENATALYFVTLYSENKQVLSKKLRVH